MHDTKKKAALPHDAETKDPPPIEIAIPKIELAQFEVRLIGDSSLICHNFDEKAKRQMLDKQMGKAQQAKAKKNPIADFHNSLYWLSDKPDNPTADDVASARFGFPASGFKNASVSACRDVDQLKMTQARGRFHVVGDFVVIEGHPTIREDMVRLNGGVADIRYRGEFKTWATRIQISYNTRAITMGQIINLLNVGGFAVGVGEWRPERDGSHGRFHCE